MTMPIPPSLREGIDATKVEYTQLGTSGLRISVPILGAMSMGSSQWAPWVLEEEESFRILKAAYDCGLNTWDTANMYSNGLSEAVIGKALKKYQIPRERVVIMTKVFLNVAKNPSVFAPMFGAQMSASKEYVNQGGLSRRSMFQAVNASLERLDTDYIDLLQIHRFDDTVPPEETMKALHDLVLSGKVHYIGASSMWATQFAQLQFIAEKNGWTKFVSMQNLYHLCYREEEREMNRFCKQTGVGIIPWSPNFGGKLARPLEMAFKGSVRATAPGPGRKDLTAADQEIINRVEELSERKGWTMSNVALAWLRYRGAVPIVGFNSVKRVEEACELRGKVLFEDDVRYLEEPYVPKPIEGHS